MSKALSPVLAPAGEDAPLRLGVPTPPITVNTVVTGDQYQPETVFLADGRFMVTWMTRNGGNFDDYDVMARVFNADGSPSGAAFVVDAPNQGLQYGGLVPGLAGGDLFAVVWTSEAGLAHDTFIRFYDTNGQPQGPAVMVNDVVQYEQSFTGGLALSGGGFVVGWRDRGDFRDWDAKLNIYDANGQPVAVGIQLALSSDGVQSISSFHPLPTGGFAVVWTDRNASSGGEDTLLVSVFDASGNQIGPSHTLGIGYPQVDRTVDVIGLEDGGIAVILDEGPALRGTELLVFNANGARIHAESLPWSQSFTTEIGAALSTGGFVLLSNQSLGDGGFSRTIFSIRDAGGRLVSSHVGIEAPVDYGVVPLRIESLPTGGFVVAWIVSQQFDDQSTDIFEVWVQTFDDLGAPIGQPVNLGFLDTYNIVWAIGPDGGVTVTWELDANNGDIAMVYIPAGDDVAPLFLLGTADDETLRGAAGDDEIYGQDGDDLLQGLGGDDRMFGGHGLDRLEGGDGNDVLVGNEFAWPEERDELIGGAGDDLIYGERSDLIDGGSGYDRLIAVNARDWTLDMAATSIEYAVMGDGDDVIDASGQTVGVSAFAGAGDDRVTGSDFNDLIFGGAGYAHDILSGGDGDDALVGELGIDELRGGEGNDRLYFDAQDSVVDGGAGYDVGYIMAAVAGVGATVDMAASSLEFVQDLAGETDTVTAVDALQGVNVFAGGGADTVTGSAFDDVIWGEAGDDVLSGGAGNDVIVGGADADRISGGLGNDALYGGAGDNAADIFVFEHTGAANADAVYDFVVGQDKIDISALTGSYDNVFIATAGADSVVWVNGQQLATLVGVTGLTASDFLLGTAMTAPDESAAPPEIAIVRLDPASEMEGLSGPLKPVIHPAPDDWLV